MLIKHNNQSVKWMFMWQLAICWIPEVCWEFFTDFILLEFCDFCVFDTLFFSRYCSWLTFVMVYPPFGWKMLSNGRFGNVFLCKIPFQNNMQPIQTYISITHQNIFRLNLMCILNITSHIALTITTYGVRSDFSTDNLVIHAIHWSKLKHILTQPSMILEQESKLGWFPTTVLF